MPAEICMGRITRPHGVKGELCVELYADSPSLLAGPVELESPKGLRTKVKISSTRQHKNFWLVRIVGIEDRTTAELLVGSSVWIPRTILPELAENEAYLADLIGKEVFLKDGTSLGTLHHIELPAGQLLWAIRNSTHEILFPARDECIVSFGEGIIIAPPPGLIEACSTEL